MQFINTQGMAFIGPGSEWFWTAVSGLVLAATFIAIYRQLRIARSANAWSQVGEIGREWDSERMTRYKLEILIARRDGTDPAAVPEAAASTVADFWERVALLVRAGHVDRNLLYQQSALSCQRWWSVLDPFIRATRARHGHPKVGQNFEWLAGDFSASMRASGQAVTFDQAYLASNLGPMIAGCRDDIRVWEALRSVVTVAPEATTPASPPYAGPETGAPAADPTVAAAPG